jgi:hypothetical protein
MIGELELGKRKSLVGNNRSCLTDLLTNCTGGRKLRGDLEVDISCDERRGG